MAAMWNGGRNRLAVVVVATWLVAVPATAQTVIDERVWTGLSLQGRLRPESPWRWISDSMVRSRDGAATLDALLERVVVTRDLTRRANLGFGYLFGVGFPAGGTIHEHALVQQYAWNGGGRRRVALKTRFEERFISGQDDVVLRARQLARVSWPLVSRGRLRGVASGELFVQLNDSSRIPAGFEQNRAFVGVARQVSRESAVEIGYLNVYARTGPDRTQMSHVMSAALAVGF